MNLKYEVLKNRKPRSHLHDLILIMKCLYPHRAVENPFEEQIYYQKDWTEEQKELVAQLVVVSALFNQKYRTWDKWMVIEAVNEDYINAIALSERLLDPKKPAALLGCSNRRFFIEVLYNFGAEPFTNRQVRLQSGLRKSTVNWHLQELISKGFLEKVGGYANKGYLYQFTNKAFV